LRHFPIQPGEYLLADRGYDPETFPAELILEYYRFRWQIESVFKHFNQIAQLGCLPKKNSENSQSWLYAKLLLALLTEKILHKAGASSPRDMTSGKKTQFLARIFFGF
jgi:hypothetical protein